MYIYIYVCLKLCVHILTGTYVQILIYSDIYLYVYDCAEYIQYNYIYIQIHMYNMYIYIYIYVYICTHYMFYRRNLVPSVRKIWSPELPKTGSFLAIFWWPQHQDREVDGETTTPLTLLKRLNAYRKQCESNGEYVEAQKARKKYEELRAKDGCKGVFLQNVFSKTMSCKVLGKTWSNATRVSTGF